MPSVTPVRILIFDPSVTRARALYKHARQHADIFYARGLQDLRASARFQRLSPPDVVLFGTDEDGRLDDLPVLRPSDWLRKAVFVGIAERRRPELAQALLEAGCSDVLIWPSSREAVQARLKLHVEIVKHSRTLRRFRWLDDESGLLAKAAFAYRLHVELAWQKRYPERVCSLIHLGYANNPWSLADGMPKQIRACAMRATDFAGAFDGAYWLALAETPPEGAQVVAQRLQELARQYHAQACFEIMTAEQAIQHDPNIGSFSVMHADVPASNHDCYHGTLSGLQLLSQA